MRFSTEDEARKALAMEGTVFYGRRLKVEMSNPLRSRSRRPAEPADARPNAAPLRPLPAPAPTSAEPAPASGAQKAVEVAAQLDCDLSRISQ